MVRAILLLTVLLLLNKFWIDWVSLDIDGVVRGDIYLEMTYYANAPAPVAAPNKKLLAHVQGSALGRRPSKLAPSDRLSRPIQQNAVGPSSSSPKQPSRLCDQSNPTSSHPGSPTRKFDSLPAIPGDEPVHNSVALSNARDLRSISPPQAIPSQHAMLPPILRPGLGGRSSPIPISNAGRQQHDFGHNRTPSESSNNRLHSTTPDVSLLPPNPYTGGSGAYTPVAVQSGLSNIDRNPYTENSDAYTAGQQHQQAPGGRAYSPTPPGAFILKNQTGPGGRSYSPPSRVQASGSSNIGGAVPLNPYTRGGGAFIPGGQHQQASGGRAYSPVPTALAQVSGPSVPISVSPPNLYTRHGGVYLPENQLGPNVSLYSPAPTPVSVQISEWSNIDHSTSTDSHSGGSGTRRPSHSSVLVSVSPPNPNAGNSGVYLPENQLVPSYSPSPTPVSVKTSGSSNINHSAPTEPYTGEGSTFIPGHQQAPDGRAYSYAPSVNTTQTSGYANYVTSLQGPRGPFPYNIGTGGNTTSAPSGPPAFPTPTIPIVVMELYGHNEPSSYVRAGLGGRSESSSYYQPPLPPPQTNNNQSEHQETPDRPHLVRYQTPLPLPPGSVKESPLPPPAPPPPAPTMATLVPSPSPPPAVAPALAPNTARVETLRKVEQDAAKRREQELKDLELAMELDRELNL